MSNSGTPVQALPGSSALGVEYPAVIANSGIIRCGYGGGGGGAGSWSDPNKSKTDYGRSGGGGGGGAGIPAGVDHSVVPSIVGGSWLGRWTCSCCSGTVDDAAVDAACAAVGGAAFGAGDVG